MEKELQIWGNSTLDCLEDLGYQGSSHSTEWLEECISNGPKSVEFTRLVEWLTTELASFQGLEDHVSAINGPDDAETFEMELSGFLREYGCPYKFLVEGPIGDRLKTPANRFKLLSYLMSELLAVRMIITNKPHLVPAKTSKQEVVENNAASLMKQMLITLGFPKPPDGITSFILFSKVEGKIKELIAKPGNPSNRPMLKARLSPKQWETIEFVNHALRQEYECRRQMLLQRLDVTILSFQWSDRTKHSMEKFQSLYNDIRRKMANRVETDIPHLLAAREDLLRIEKTSGGSVRERMKCDINRVLIGNVPDRGGRAYEMEPPPPEMPSFQQRQQPMQQRDFGGSARGGGMSDRQRGSDGHRGGGGGGSRGGREGGGGGWGQNPVAAYGQNSDNPAAKFYGGDGGYRQQSSAPQFCGNQQYGAPTYGYQQPVPQSQQYGQQPQYGSSGGYSQQGGGYYQQQQQNYHQPDSYQSGRGSDGRGGGGGGRGGRGGRGQGRGGYR